MEGRNMYKRHIIKLEDVRDGSHIKIITTQELGFFPFDEQIPKLLKDKFGGKAKYYEVLQMSSFTKRQEVPNE